MNDLLEKVTIIFREVFDDPNLVITEATTAADIDGWDSFAHINLVVALEEVFNVSFSTQEFSVWTSVGDCLQSLQEKRVKGTDGYGN